MSIIPELGRLRQEDHELNANLGYLASSRPFGIHRLRKRKKMTIYAHSALLQGIVNAIHVAWAELFTIRYLNKR